MKKLISAICFMFALAPLAFAQEKAKVDGGAAVGGKKAEASATVKKTEGGAAVDAKAAAAEKPKKEPTAKQKAQQERMKSCNEKATDKKGDERKKYMSSCLKGEDADASPKQKVQQNKMKTCNKDAGDKKLKGDERKKFMSECLSG